MSTVKLDDATAALLRAAEPGAELVGPDGKPVGGFVPARMLAELRWLLAERQRLHQAAEAVTTEQLRASRAAGGRIPHAEVMRRLGLQ